MQFNGMSQPVLVGQGGRESEKKGKKEHEKSTLKIVTLNGISVTFTQVINRCGHSQPITKKQFTKQ